MIHVRMFANGGDSLRIQTLKFPAHRRWWWESLDKVDRETSKQLNVGSHGYLMFDYMSSCSVHFRSGLA